MQVFEEKNKRPALVAGFFVKSAISSAIRVPQMQIERLPCITAQEP